MEQASPLNEQEDCAVPSGPALLSNLFPVLPCFLDLLSPILKIHCFISVVHHLWHSGTGCYQKGFWVLEHLEDARQSLLGVVHAYVTSCYGGPPTPEPWGPLLSSAARRQDLCLVGLQLVQMQLGVQAVLADVTALPLYPHESESIISCPLGVRREILLAVSFQVFSLTVRYVCVWEKRFIL